LHFVLHEPQLIQSFWQQDGIQRALISLDCRMRVLFEIGDCALYDIFTKTEAFCN